MDTYSFSFFFTCLSGRTSPQHASDLVKHFPFSVLAQLKFPVFFNSLAFLTFTFDTTKYSHVFCIVQVGGARVISITNNQFFFDGFY